MLRALCFTVLATLSIPAVAEEQIAIIHAGDTAQITVGDTQAIAFHKMERKGMRVTMIFTDAEGEMLRTRVFLDDGQSHAVIMDATEDETTGYRFTIHREGNAVQMSGVDLAAPTEVAARY